MAAELLKMRSGISFTHVPYKGGIQELPNLLSGVVHFTIDGGPVFVPHAESGKLRLLAVTTAQRLPQYSTIPTIAESYPGFEATAWQMILVTAGTPKAIVDKIYAASAAALRESDVQERLRNLGVQPVGSTPEESAAFLRSEMKKWAEVIRVSGAKIE
jgi:tripartite-type tricarboxylate transporter receptor subunit TctC